MVLKAVHTLVCWILSLIASLLALLADLGALGTGILLPTLQSFEALESSHLNSAEWLKYWVVLAGAYILETWGAFRSIRGPVYSLSRFFFVSWLALPQFKGAAIVYTAIQPVLTRVIDEAQRVAVVNPALSSLHASVLGFAEAEGYSVLSAYVCLGSSVVALLVGLLFVADVINKQIRNRSGRRFFADCISWMLRLCNVTIGIILPIAYTFNAIELSNTGDMAQWLTYWVVLGTLGGLWTLSGPILVDLFPGVPYNVLHMVLIITMMVLESEATSNLHATITPGLRAGIGMMSPYREILEVDQKTLARALGEAARVAYEMSIKALNTLAAEIMAGPLAEINSKNISEKGAAIWATAVAGIERARQELNRIAAEIMAGPLADLNSKNISERGYAIWGAIVAGVERGHQWLTTEVCPVLVNNLRDWSEKGMALWHTFSGRLQSVMLGNFYIMSRVLWTIVTLPWAFVVGSLRTVWVLISIFLTAFKATCFFFIRAVIEISVIILAEICIVLYHIRNDPDFRTMLRAYNIA